jgi:hypothetical protein
LWVLSLELFESAGSSFGKAAGCRRTHGYAENRGLPISTVVGMLVLQAITPAHDLIKVG